MTVTGLNGRMGSLGVLFSAVAMSGCGGGGGGKDAVCADFRYQEDAQAAFAAGAKQLDGDKDGIACESLPRRPTTSPSPAPSPAPAPAPTPTPVWLNFMSVEGDIRQLRGTTAAATMTQYGALGSGSLTGAISMVTGASIDTKQWQSGASVLRYSGYWTDAMVAWLPLSVYAGEGSRAVAFAAYETSVVMLNGRYSLLGQACAVGGGSCSPVSASANLDVSGAVSICPNAAWAQGCAGELKVQMAAADGGTKAVWTLGDDSARLIGSEARGAIALTFQDGYGPGAPRTRYTFLGHKQSLNTAFGRAGGDILAGFNLLGTAAETSGPPMTGGTVDATGVTSRSSDGSRWVRSTTGQLVYWNGSAQRLEVYWQRP